MKVSIVGVVVGGFVDVVTSFLLTLPLEAYAVMHKAGAGPAPVTTQGRMQAQPAITIVEMLLSLVCSALGGYVSAAIAQRHERLNGTLSCWLCVGLGIALMALGLSKDPLWLQAMLMLLSPIMAFLGGDLRLRQRMRRPAAAVGV